jgi:orotidine-5'-phosphate decarboxylase
MSAARAKLVDAWRGSGSLLSVGLEPSPKYLPRGFEPTLVGHERFLLGLIEATEGLACAYKLNVAFFEALGAEGWALMERVRARVPRQCLLIADGKFSDIGTTAERYAEAIYAQLDADAATVNPIMGRDSVEPWLAHADRLTFFLVLTSNPGASDFLLADGLYRRIARRLVEWGAQAQVPGSVGFVVGATRTDRIGEVRQIGPDVPFLVPGVGAQGGSVRETVNAGRAEGGADAFPALLFHVTRGVLPGPEEQGDVFEIVRRKAEGWRDSVNRALAGGDDGR